MLGNEQDRRYGRTSVSALEAKARGSVSEISQARILDPEKSRIGSDIPFAQRLPARHASPPPVDVMPFVARRLEQAQAAREIRPPRAG
jgi:hypothetical protein